MPSNLMFWWMQTLSSAARVPGGAASGPSHSASRTIGRQRPVSTHLLALWAADHSPIEFCHH